MKKQGDKLADVWGTAGGKGLGQSTPAKSGTTRGATPGGRAEGAGVHAPSSRAQRQWGRAGKGEGSTCPPAGLTETAGTEAFTLSEK